jgi:hypothetical protein
MRIMTFVASVCDLVCVGRSDGGRVACVHSFGYDKGVVMRNFVDPMYLVKLYPFRTSFVLEC